MRCVMYRRVSTDMQKEEGFSLEAQKMRLEAFALSQGWTIVDDYCDDGYSAKNMDRPALQRLIKDMQQKKFDVVIVYRLDRLVRSVLDLHKLLKIMQKYDVMFKSATESFETTTANGRLFITIVATIAEWERETIAERVFENMLERSKTGQRNGAPAPYGYDLVDGELRINEEEAKWVRFIFEKYKTHGSQNIAKQLNQRGVKTKKGEMWSDFSVRYVLRNPIYAGYIRWNYRSMSKQKLGGQPVVTPIKQENFVPIISKETFQEVQELLQNRYNMAFRSDSHYPFSGVARCAKCGKSFTGAQRKRKSGGVYRYYKCQGRFKFGNCDVQTIAEEAIEKAFLEALHIPEKLELEVETNESEKELDTDFIEKQLQKLKGRKERIKELYIEGEIPKDEYNKRMQEIAIQEMELYELLNEYEEEASLEEIKTVLENIKKEWHNLSYEAKKYAIRSLFEYITIEIVEPTKMGKYPEPPKLKITDYRFR
ncbi:recombinase family protein [Parageobacillus thermoglucosidasius]|uniref:recombinase family protein n=2 Tax=Parageobacillus thermoglucosidasius TaxID=1426 RepID=UPI000E146D00|nr:recombinase family protein [Parageobacillus thermoglucosidasius]RDE28702.1 recombinase family protein [Parageobacillus thermoglucosidasius]